MWFYENIECWRAGNNSPSSYSLCSMVGKGTELRWAEVGIASLYCTWSMVMNECSEVNCCVQKWNMAILSLFRIGYCKFPLILFCFRQEADTYNYNSVVRNCSFSRLPSVRRYFPTLLLCSNCKQMFMLGISIFFPFLMTCCREEVDIEWALVRTWESLFPACYLLALSNLALPSL
jgi:hypothetical protein